MRTLLLVSALVIAAVTSPRGAGGDDNLPGVAAAEVGDGGNRLLQALAAGSLEEVKRAAKGVDVKQLPNLPHEALTSPNADVVAFLRDAGGFEITDLQIAAIRGDARRVDTLLGPLDENARRLALAVWSSPILSHSPLSLAVRNGHAEVVRVLIARGADVNETAHYTHTPLANAAERGHAEIVKLLLRAGAKPDAATDGYTALMRACIGGQSRTAALLLAAGADPSLARHDGRRALHFAALRGDVDCVKLLLEHGADAAAIANQSETALTLATSGKHQDIVRVLRETGPR